MPKTQLVYLPGFRNEHISEAKVGAVPVGKNSPQKTPYGLYAEQLSGSAFTQPRKENFRSWLYKIRPSVLHGGFTEAKGFAKWISEASETPPPEPSQLRWDPYTIPKKTHDFIDGIVTFALNGSATNRLGNAVHLYSCNSSMTDRFFTNSDGEMLIVPQSGTLVFHTEFGVLEVAPTEIIVIPRGIKFRVELTGSNARGYICENFGAPFDLPNLGPIGANGLAASRDFLAPTAKYEDVRGKFELLTRFGGGMWSSKLTYSPLDCVGWFGNYYPFKYDLNKFNTIGTVSFDHPDPSIFTVLTSATNSPGLANVDFVIFPPRWMVANDTFRPPYFHRNIMSEFMGLIKGVYDAKPAGGFEPGGASLHNCMQAHGPEADAYDKAVAANLSPTYLDQTLAFMFESSMIYRPTLAAMTSPILQKNYLQCWSKLKSGFTAHAEVSSNSATSHLRKKSKSSRR